MTSSNNQTYSLLQISLHWLSALLVIGLFIVGIWMVDLDYYNPWYKDAPDWHKAIGVFLAVLTVIRLLTKIFSPKVSSIETHQSWEKILAKLTHIIFYGLLFTMFVSGYLISTANGESLKVFSWFEIPALITGENQADNAGELHQVIAYILIGLASIHALAALKHHFIDKDNTLKRMLGFFKSKTIK